MLGGGGAAASWARSAAACAARSRMRRSLKSIGPSISSVAVSSRGVDRAFSRTAQYVELSKTRCAR